MSSAEELYAGLDDEFSDYLRNRAVSREIAIERGYKLVRQGKPLDGDYAATWGFPRKAAGLLMPLHGVLDDDPLDSRQLRIHKALESVFTKPNGKVQRFLTPRGQRNVLATAPRTRPLLSEPDQVILFAEGVTRVDALAGYALPAVGMTGMFNWRSLTALSDFEAIAIRGNRMVVVPDGDVRVLKEIFAAVTRLMNFLKGKRAHSVSVVALPDGQGLDDWIAAHAFEKVEELVHALREHETDRIRFAPPVVPGPNGKFEGPQNPYADPAGAGERPKAEAPTERHFARVFADKQSEMYRYDADARVWRRWSGGRWSEAEHHITVDVGEHLEAARAAFDLGVETVGLSKHKHVLELAQAFGVQEFDPNPHLLGLPWGEVLDTTTATTATLMREHFVTHSLPEAIKRPPEDLNVWETDWGEFVKECLVHYEEVDRMAVAVYLQRWAGVALTANCDDEQAVYLYGVAGTGKGTFSETLLAMMGEYGYAVSGSRIVGEHSQHSQWKAGARGKRLIVFDEVPPGRWRDDELDPLISGQMIEANKMRENSIQFRSQAKLIFTGNSRPSSKAASGIWRRLRIVQFQNEMDEDAKDPGLRKKFREQQLDDVFAWALAGLSNYLKSGGRLTTPGILRETTAEFRKDADQYPQWLEDSLERAPDAWTSITDLYDSLREWWSANNDSRSPSKRAMTMALGDLGFETTREGHERERGKAGLQRRQARML